METNKYNWLKKLGVAGFLFFLIKGLLWLTFGTALWKWLQNLFNIIFVVGFLGGQEVCAQYSVDKKSYSKSVLFNKTKVPQFERIPTIQPIFCQWEHALSEKFQLPIAFRLGNLLYTRKMEYPYLKQ